jgi:hypothetical protein
VAASSIADCHPDPQAFAWPTANWNRVKKLGIAREPGRLHILFDFDKLTGLT